MRRSVSQRCLLLVGDLVAELDPEVDELVRSQLLLGLAAKVADSKVVVRKAASQVRPRRPPSPMASSWLAGWPLGWVVGWLLG